MATTGRDYYELLGVGRDADEQEIKRAFRKLARELHPDVSEAPDAGERFREVAEAYQVLSNSETREVYDRYGHAGLRGGGFTPGSFDFGSLSDIFSAFFGDNLFGGGAARRARGADIAAEVEIELVEAARGATRDVPFRISVACDRCHGNGAEPGTTPGHLPDVQRSRPRPAGIAQRVRRIRARAGLPALRRRRPDRRRRPVRSARAPAVRSRSAKLAVTIPAGIHDGQQIRISGEGHAGQLGGRAGDVYVRVRVRTDPRFVRDGDDILSTVDLNVVEAALGKSVTVETLEGPLELEFEAGTQPGEHRVLRGRGMPVLQGFGRGDHRVLVNVAVPRRLTDEQRRLLEEFERLDRRDVRARRSFFEKLKSAFR